MLGCKWGNEWPTVGVIALYSFNVLTSSGLPSFVTPPSSDWGEGEGHANLSGLHSSQYFASYLSRLDGGIMGGRGSVLVKHCALRLATPAHRLTSFGAQPQAFFCTCGIDGTCIIAALTLPTLTNVNWYLTQIRLVLALFALTLHWRVCWDAKGGVRGLLLMQ